jgi:large subunit ribosomal protein L24
MRKIKRNDNVLVTTGKDRGKTGIVREVITKKNRVVVEGVNLVKKHQRPTQQGGVPAPGGIITKEAPLDISNVMLICGNCNRATRTSVRVRTDGAKVRVCKRCGADID